ncbi:DUF4317 domain-containing protein [Clostridium felsineum]|uniref:DUF4317 domain-containing protein n=1 Tax=Clostridium felsineum TaxID=36839 RepID=UPI00214D72DC|nr:DUF4317 domain-containing protein [Clostridium felsineum]MCR3759424.1 DUF4317 domain-containing protein [Clostridium felsineum]
MNKKEILELKRRFKKDECTFTRMCGCYVDAQKNIVLKLKETFLNLQDEEFFKYLEIAKKTLSGTVGNNLLELEFPLTEEADNNRQLSLLGLKKSALKDDGLLDSFYNLIIDSYDYAGNFLILIFHDAYDVMTKTTDNAKLDESEEIYEYILCAVCPVSLSKAALGYLEDENRIGARNRDWIVGPPDVGFVFPAFTDRSSDIHSIMYYTKNAKDTHPELMEGALGCSSKQSATQEKEKFNTIIRKAIGSDDKKSELLFMDIQETLSNVIDDNSTINGDDAEPVILTKDNIQDILVESGLSEEITEKIQKSYEEEFSDTPPVVENLIDKKALKVNEQRKKERRLEEKVQMLEERLDQTNKETIKDSEEAALETDTTASLEQENNIELEIETPSETDIDTNTDIDPNTDIDTKASSNYDIVLQVKPEKVPEIKSQIIDGKKCIVIPIEDNEQANVNGVDTSL